MLVGPTALIGMIRFFFVKEKYVDAKRPTEKTKEDSEASAEKKSRKKMDGVSVLTGIKAIGKNKYILLLMVMIIAIIIASGVMNTAQAYYFKYFVGDISKMSIVNFSLVFSILMLVIFVPLANKFGKCRIMQIGLILATLGCLIRFLGGTNIVTLFIGMSLIMFGIMPVSVYFPLYLFDIIDYGEWKTGDRVEGMLAALPSFATKVANGLSVSLASLILGHAGYDGKLAEQTEAAMRAINLNYNIIPLICLAVMTAISLIWFNLDKVMPTVKKELAERRDNKEA